MTIRIGRLTEERVADAFRVFTTALVLESPSEERLERRRNGLFADRAVVAYDGDAVVGHVGSLPFHTFVPGGELVPTAGLSRVGVLPSHRRKGLLTRMMHQSLGEARERGEVLGSLRAAEAAIYGRFGYGLAGLAAAIRVRTDRSAFAVPVEVPGRFGVMQGAVFLECAKAAYRRSIRRPGMLDRPDWYWEVIYDAHRDEAPNVADWGVVHFDAEGRPDGFARWAPVDREHWKQRGHEVELSDLLGETPEIEAALWRFVLDLDLVERVTSEERPLEDPIRYRFVDQRVLETTEVWDEQWVRLIDVRAALAARTYGGDDAVVIGVTHDSVFADNVARYEVGAAGCRRVRRAPDVELPIHALGAVYLGGTSFHSLAAAGVVHERKPGALVRADRLFHSPVTPFCGSFF